MFLVKKIICPILAAVFLFTGCYSTLNYGKNYQNRCNYCISLENDKPIATSLEVKYKDEIKNADAKKINSYYILSLFPESKKYVDNAGNDFKSSDIDAVIYCASLAVVGGTFFNYIHLAVSGAKQDSVNVNTTIAVSGAGIAVFFLGRTIYDYESGMNNLRKSIEEFYKACPEK